MQKYSTDQPIKTISQYHNAMVYDQTEDVAFTIFFQRRIALSDHPIRWELQPDLLLWRWSFDEKGSFSSLQR